MDVDALQNAPPESRSGPDPDATATSPGVRHAVEQLAPGSFAIVMAGGIDSVGLKVENDELLSDGLFVVAIGAYLVTKFISQG